MGLTVIRNFNDVLRDKALTTTNVLQGALHRQGDYELVVFEIPAHTLAKASLSSLRSD